MTDKIIIPAAARETYTQGCNMYLLLFCEKHGYGYEEDAWVGNAPGGVALVGDYYVGMDTIKTDIDMDAPEEEFLKWYDYNIEAGDFNLTTPNFESWLRGCPRTSPETFKKLRGMREELKTLINEERERTGEYE